MLLLASGELDGFWAVRLDGDDPPVVWADSVPSNPSLGGWEQVAGSFSEFVLGCVWQYDLTGRAYPDGGSLIGSCQPPLRPCDLAFLLANYEQGPMLREPFGYPVYLFRRQGAYVCVVDNQGSGGFSTWWVSGPTRQSLQECLEQLRRPGYLFAEEYPPYRFDAAEDIWEDLHDHPPPYPGPGWENVFGVDPAPLFARGELLESGREPALPPHVDYLIEQIGKPHRKAFPHGLTAYHFSGPVSRLLIVSQDYSAKEGQSNWWLHGDSLADLEALLEPGWRLGDLQEGLQARSEAGRRLLSGRRPTEMRC